MPSQSFPTFRSTLPLSAASATRVALAASGTLTMVDTGKSQTILVVEDEASIASFVALYLKNAGYSVGTAATGGEALTHGRVGAAGADHPRPDPPGHRRIEICRRIRKSADVPILMLTARDEDVDKIIGLEVGADDYLTKPFNPRELVARVKSRAAAHDADRRIWRPRRSARRPPHRRRTREVRVGRRGVSSRRRSSTCSGSSSTTEGSCSRATSFSSASGATRSPATRGPSTCTCGSCAASSATRRRSSPSGASATRSSPAREPATSGG